MYDNRIIRRLPVRLAAAAVVLCLAGAATAGPRSKSPQSFAAAARDSATQTAQKMWQGAQDVALFALGLIGVDYRFGGNTPDAGLDCSGLIRYVFQEVTGTTLPRTSREMSRLGDKVAMADLAPGDLVFFNTRRFAYSHVGLYLGDDRFIHAPATGGEVEVANLSQSYWKKHYDGARRVVGVLPSLVPTMINAAVAAPVAPATTTAGAPPGAMATRESATAARGTAPAIPLPQLPSAFTDGP